jgi:sugar/nucleoside kinase (ribokinase family)
MTRSAPDVVVVGSAARDVDESDPRGWRLGGGVAYGALALARMGIRTGALIGLDGHASEADELDLLRAAGVELAPVELDAGPVFHNVEQATGRVQTCLSPSDPIPGTAVPSSWRGAPAWMFAPVAAEIPDEWTDVPTRGACVALGWQGMLRRLVAGRRVEQLAPGASPLLARVTVLGMSRHDVPGALVLRELSEWLSPGAEILLTAGTLGGLLLTVGERGLDHVARYPAIRASRELDPTGAGDVALAGLLAARIAGGRRIRVGQDLLIAAAAASLVVEGPGLEAVPTLEAVRARLVGHTGGAS